MDLLAFVVLEWVAVKGGVMEGENRNFLKAWNCNKNLGWDGKKNVLKCGMAKYFWVEWQKKIG